MTGGYSLRETNLEEDELLRGKEIRELIQLYRKAKNIKDGIKVDLINGQQGEFHYVLIGAGMDRETLEARGDKFYYKYKKLAIDDIMLNYELQILQHLISYQDREGLKAITNFINQK